MGCGRFHNGIGDGLGGPFVGLNDSFVECRFSLLEVSLGYDVLPSVNFIAKPFRFNDSSPL